jgi:hypothetical protein
MSKIVLFAVCAMLFLAAFKAACGQTIPDDWSRSAVIYGELIEIERTGRVDNPRAKMGTYQCRLKPIAVLTGTFDAAQRSEVSIAFALGFPLSDLEEHPQTGAKVVVWIQRNIDGFYGLRGRKPFFFPAKNEWRPGMIEVKGLADPEVAVVVEQLCKRRDVETKKESPPSEPFVRKIEPIDVNKERDPEYWKNAAVIYAEVVELQPGSKRALKPIAVATGNFDAALQGEFTPTNAAEQGVGGLPPTGTKVLVVVERQEGTYRIPQRAAAISPKDALGPALIELTDFDDPKLRPSLDRLSDIRAPLPYVEPIKRPYR